VTTAISFTTFFLPHECGERIGLGITCLLVICAIMMVSADLMPITDQRTVLGSFYAGCFMYTLLSLLVTILTGLLVHQVGDGDADGEQGTFFVTRVLGLKPIQALQMSFRLDFYMGILCPVTFTAFCVVVLHPHWPTGSHVGVVIGILLATVFLIVFAVLCLNLLHKLLGIENNDMAFINIFWKFRNTASNEVKKVEKEELVIEPCLRAAPTFVTCEAADEC